MNLPRVHARRQADLVEAGRFAAGELPSLGWYEHQTDDPHEAKLCRNLALQSAVSRQGRI